MTRILAAATLALAVLAPLSGAFVVATGLLILWLTVVALAAPRERLT